MDKFSIGDTVKVTKMGWVGTITHYDEKRGKYLVLISATQQMYYTPEELELYKK